MAALLVAVGLVVVPAPVQGAAPAFKHPGVMMSKGQLERMRKNIKREPWRSAYREMVGSKYGRLSYRATPRAVVACGSRSKPDLGCKDERKDALAAYTHALIWYVSRKPAHGYKAMKIMDAWSGTIKTHTKSNAPLQTGWAGSHWARAGEIIRYSVPKKNWPKMPRFSRMLKTVYLPGLLKGSTFNGNWELIMTDAALGISVFLDDRASFNQAVALWRRRVPAYVYLKSDGALPVAAPGKPDVVKYWFKQDTFADGLAQETCRDLSHVSWGLGAALHGAETAGIQGVDLYKEGQERLIKSLEFHAQYATNAKPVPGWLCKGRLRREMEPVLELGWNHYHNRLNLPMPYTKRLVASQRPAGEGHFFGWETLTHG